MKTWEDIVRACPGQVLAWADEQPWARAMALCGQDAGWHAEGDVWTHTKMVYDQVLALPEFRAEAMAPDDRLKLMFCALFHDSGKPATSLVDLETGRTRSPKHAKVGMEIGRGVLRSLGCPVALREEILGLVRYHGRPPYLLEKEDAALEVIKLSWLVNHRLLYLFALADTRGRKTAEMGRPEEVLELWKVAAEEAGCFEKPYAFANDQARFLFYRGELSSLHYVPREEFKSTVTLMSGLPGAGKDTWLSRERAGLAVVSLDGLREEMEVSATEDQGGVIHAAREMCRGYLREGRDFAFNATNTMGLTRKRWIDLFADYGARVEIVYVEPALSEILAQNKRREKSVPSAVMARLVEKLEPPSVTEGHGLTVVGGHA
jgi:putative nucleotidyltransferase with HDIG domain